MSSNFLSVTSVKTYLELINSSIFSEKLIPEIAIEGITENIPNQFAKCFPHNSWPLSINHQITLLLFQHHFSDFHNVFIIVKLIIPQAIYKSWCDIKLHLWVLYCFLKQIRLLLTRYLIWWKFDIAVLCFHLNFMEHLLRLSGDWLVGNQLRKNFGSR